MLVQHVRDEALRSCDREVDRQSRTPLGRRWAQLLSHGLDPEALKTILPDAVDDTIFYLLNAIDQEVLRLSYVAESGEVVGLTQEGGLGGWYMATGGWRALYSQERFSDDLADLRPDDKE